MLSVVRSSKYQQATDEKKAELLEEARDGVPENTKAAFMKWLVSSGAKSEKKTKRQKERLGGFHTSEPFCVYSAVSSSLRA